MSLVKFCAPTTAQVCSAIRVRCEDCRALVGLFEFEPNPWHGRGLTDVHAVQVALVAHALEAPLLHPTLLPGHHGAAPAREGTA